MDDDDKEYYTAPLTEQAVFGAGLKRKRIAFVPANTCSATCANPQKPQTIASSRYLSIVLPSQNEEASDGEASPASNITCKVCSLPLTVDPQLNLDSDAPSTSATHAATLVHQACLPHSHPPSHLDRGRKGLKYLSSYGWDPDARVGLGRKGGEGRLAPVKAKEKNDTLGLGVKITTKNGKPGVKNEKRKEVKVLDAKGVRKKVAEDRKREEVLRRTIWGREDVTRYLGEA